MITEHIEKFVDRYSLGRDKGEDSKHFLRIKIPNGMLTAEQFKVIALLSQRYSKGYAEITGRQDIQLHWIESEDALDIFSKLEEIGFTTDKCGQAYPGARYGDVRDIVGCPVAGVDRFELIDASSIVKQLDDFFTGNKEFLDLPRKFKISVSGCSLNCISPEVHDLSFVALRHPFGRRGFAILVGGTVGVAPQLARPLDVFVKPEEVIDVTKVMVEIFRDYGSRERKVKARFRWLVDAWGTEKLKKTIEEKIGRTLETYKLEYLPTCRGEHMGVQPQKQEGYFYISVPILGGALSSDKMLKIADIANEFGSGELRLSAFQNLVIINIPNKFVNLALNSLEEIGLSVTGSIVKWTTIACAGNFCGKAPEHPKKRAVEVIDYLEKRLGESLSNLKLRISFSGCPNGCARHLTADIGLQGAQLIIEGKPEPCYNIYVGESAGLNASLGKLIGRGIKAAQIKYALENLIKVYVEKKTNLESFREFCNRHTAEELRLFLNTTLRQEAK